MLLIILCVNNVVMCAGVGCGRNSNTSDKLNISL